MLIDIGYGLSPYRQIRSRFNPLDLPNLVSMQDVQDFSQISFTSGGGNGDPVSAWGDVTGNGNGFARNGASTHQLVYKEIGALGKPALRKTGPQVSFDSVSTTMYGAAVTQVIFFSPLGTATVAVGMIAGLLNGTAYMGTLSGGVPAYVRQQVGGNLTLAAWGDVNDLLMLAVSITNNTTAKFHNGINAAAFDPDDNYALNGAARIGSYTPTTNAPECEYYAHLLFDAAVDDDTMAKIYDWGRKKYGVVS